MATYSRNLADGGVARKTPPKSRPKVSQPVHQELVRLTLPAKRVKPASQTFKPIKSNPRVNDLLKQAKKTKP
jgi:hypothetical protein